MCHTFSCREGCIQLCWPCSLVDDDAANSAQVAMGMPPVQKAVLAMLPKLAPKRMPHLYPEFIYSIVRLLRPEHAVEQWAEQQQNSLEQAASDAVSMQHASDNSIASTTTAAQHGIALLDTGSSNSAASNITTVKQPSGQTAQAKFALTSAFLEKVGECSSGHGFMHQLVIALRFLLFHFCRSLSSC